MDAGSVRSNAHRRRTSCPKDRPLGRYFPRRPGIIYRGVYARACVYVSSAITQNPRVFCFREIDGDHGDRIGYQRFIGNTEYMLPPLPLESWPCFGKQRSLFLSRSIAVYREDKFTLCLGITSVCVPWVLLKCESLCIRITCFLGRLLEC